VLQRELEHVVLIREERLHVLALDERRPSGVTVFVLHWYVSDFHLTPPLKKTTTQKTPTTTAPRAVLHLRFAAF
jgi:hypothetical protein